MNMACSWWEVWEIQSTFMGGGEDSAAWCVDGDGLASETDVHDGRVDSTKVGSAAGVSNGGNTR